MVLTPKRTESLIFYFTNCALFIINLFLFNYYFIMNEEATYNFINLDYVDLMSDGDTDMKKIMLEMLFDEPVEEIEKMKQANKEQDWKTLKEVSHKMKSTLSFVGNDILTESNKEVEAIAMKVENTEKLSGLLDTLAEEYQKALKELKIEHGRL